MEPINLTPSPSDDPALDALLRQPPPPLPDAGFSARVLASLPPSRRPFDFRRFALCALAIAAALLVAPPTPLPLSLLSTLWNNFLMDATLGFTHLIMVLWPAVLALAFAYALHVLFTEESTI